MNARLKALLKTVGQTLYLGWFSFHLGFLKSLLSCHLLWISCFLCRNFLLHGLPKHICLVLCEMTLGIQNNWMELLDDIFFVRSLQCPCVWSHAVNCRTGGLELGVPVVKW